MNPQSEKKSSNFSLSLSGNGMETVIAVVISLSSSSICANHRIASMHYQLNSMNIFVIFRILWEHDLMSSPVPAQIIDVQLGCISLYLLTKHICIHYVCV